MKTKDYEKEALELSWEIEDLESKIAEIKSINKEKSIIKNLKICKGSLRVLAPYLVTSGIFLISSSFLGATPHYNDKIDVDTIKVLDASEKPRYMYLDKNTNSKYQNVIKEYSKWNKNKDGIYIRNVTSYRLSDDLKEEEIKAYLENDNVKLEDLFSIENKGYEERPYLSKEELSSNKSYMEAYIFNDDSYKAIIRETDKENNRLTIAFYVILGMLLIFVKLVRTKVIDGFKFREYVNELKEKYEFIDIDSLLEELGIKKEEYHNITKKR